jgi:membrane-bound lytic murein transglycosylase B
MMKKTLTIALVLLCCVAATAQDKPKAETTAPVLTQEQQRQLAQAVTQAREAQLQAEAAQAKLDAARAQVEATVYRIMALLKVSPEDYELKAGQGGFVLAPKEKPQGRQ